MLVSRERNLLAKGKRHPEKINVSVNVNYYIFLRRCSNTLLGHLSQTRIGTILPTRSVSKQQKIVVEWRVYDVYEREREISSTNRGTSKRVQKEETNAHGDTKYRFETVSSRIIRLIARNYPVEWVPSLGIS